MSYAEFLAAKRSLAEPSGFDVAPEALNPALFDFQRELVGWALRQGRAALFADTGLGKTAMQLEWARLIHERTGGDVLILTPLAVSHQTVAEGAKFGVDVHRSMDGVAHRGITVTNYERLHYFDPAAFVGAVCDESAILKSFDGARRNEITRFMRQMPYRLLCSATPAPNDYTELGTSSEALGYLGHVDMLNRFFVNERQTTAVKRSKKNGIWSKESEWRFKGHAELGFWRWACSWARAIRKPSDLGYDDGAFALPPLTERQHVVTARTPPPGMLFVVDAVTLREQRDERRRTLEERCQMVAALVYHDQPALVWCHLNAEGDRLERLIPGAVQVSGSEPDEAKEEKLIAFATGQARVLVTKPRIAGWGLNFQHCAHTTFFPSHSYEQYYQGVRRCWRYGQTQPVVVDIVTTEGERRVLRNLQTKALAADAMFARLVAEMNDALGIERRDTYIHEPHVPAWLRESVTV
jgi:SNF2 family DNA or RNA helicase